MLRKSFPSILLFSFLILLPLACSKAPKVEWEKYEGPETMESAMAGNQPILAYFYAAWCPPCYELRETTFRDPEVIEALSGFRRIKLDMSYKRSPKILELHRQYEVRGLPHMILISPGDEPENWIRMSGYIGKERFMSVLKRFMNKVFY